MAFVRLYTGDDGESHFQDVQMPPPDAPETNRLHRPIGAPGDALMTNHDERIVTLPTAGRISFFNYPDGGSEDWHPSRERAYVIIISGGFIEIRLGDGTVRTFYPGDVMQQENTTGRGHQDRCLGGVVLAIVPLAD